MRIRSGMGLYDEASFVTPAERPRFVDDARGEARRRILAVHPEQPPAAVPSALLPRMPAFVSSDERLARRLEQLDGGDGAPIAGPALDRRMRELRLVDPPPPPPPEEPMGAPRKGTPKSEERHAALRAFLEKKGSASADELRREFPYYEDGGGSQLLRKDAEAIGAQHAHRKAPWTLGEQPPEEHAEKAKPSPRAKPDEVHELPLEADELPDPKTLPAPYLRRCVEELLRRVAVLDELQRVLGSR